MTKRRLTQEELSMAIDRAARGGRPLAPAHTHGEHLISCLVCGQMFDVRDLEQVLYHVRGEHQPMRSDR